MRDSSLLRRPWRLSSTQLLVRFFADWGEEAQDKEVHQQWEDDWDDDDVNDDFSQQLRAELAKSAE
jgi:hypothetical protein